MPAVQIASLLAGVPVFVLVLCRVGGLMLFAPLFGSARIPKRVRGLLALVIALGLAGGIPPLRHPPTTPGGAAVALGGELAFGLALGMVTSFVFIAAQWAGDIVGQQIGFNIAETFDPQFGAASSVIGDMYYMLTLVVFLSVGGHRQIIRGLSDSFDALPLMTVGVDASVLGIVLRAFASATELAARLAAPIMVTMLIVDLTLGFLGKSMPQLNVQAMGLSLKAMVGMAVIMLGLALYSTPHVLEVAIERSVETARMVWAGHGG